MDLPAFQRHVDNLQRLLADPHPRKLVWQNAVRTELDAANRAATRREPMHPELSAGDYRPDQPSP